MADRLSAAGKFEQPADFIERQTPYRQQTYQRSRAGQTPLPYLIQVKLWLCMANVLEVVFFDHFFIQKIPVSDQNLHKNIFWPKMGQSLVGDTMKRKKWFCWLWQCTLLLWQWVVVAPRPAGMGHIFLLTLLWLRAFNCRSRLGWSMSLFLVALAFGFSAHHNYLIYCILQGYLLFILAGPLTKG